MTEQKPGKNQEIDPESLSYRLKSRVRIVERRTAPDKLEELQGWHHTLIASFFEIKIKKSDIQEYRNLIWLNPVSILFFWFYPIYWMFWTLLSKQITSLFYSSTKFRNLLFMVYLYLTNESDLTTNNKKLRDSILSQVSAVSA